MPSSQFASIRERVRTSFRDVDATMFSDDWLDCFIDDAQRVWAMLTESIVGKEEITQNVSGVLSLPGDCIRPIRLVGADGFELPAVPWKRLHGSYDDFRDITGNFAQAVVYDYDTFGKFRVFPKVPNGTELGVLEYVRRPQEGVLEVGNTDAVCYYVLWIATTFASRGSSPLWRDKFLKEVQEYNASKVSRLGRLSRGGRYF